MLRTVGALTAIGLAAIVSPATAADVTPERLLNTTSDPQNWLMVHRDYDNSRHSGLKDINKDNAKELKLKFMISIGGRATGGTLRGKARLSLPSRCVTSRFCEFKLLSAATRQCESNWKCPTLAKRESDLSL